MSFFGDVQPGIRFTQQQQIFFKTKLAFLDPTQSKSIQIGQALSLLKFSGLSGALQKQIITNLGLTGKLKIDYTDMKKILRGVALAQNKITPSSVNINENIKTKMPQFYDDDQSQQEHEPQKQKTSPQPAVQPPQPAVVQVVKQQPKPVVQEVNKPSQQASPTNFFDDFAPTPPAKAKSSSISAPQNPPSPVTQNKLQAELAKSIQKFQDFWSTLTTQNGVKISGDEMKKLFAKSQNRKSLSKIWKLCNNTYKGSLSKGELFVFMSLMKSKSGHVPSHLSPQMKQAIQKLDGDNHNRATDNRISGSHNAFDFEKSHNFDKSQHQQTQKKISTQHSRPRASTTTANVNVFDDFANFSKPQQPSNPRDSLQLVEKSQQYKPSSMQKSNFFDMPQQTQKMVQPQPTQVRVMVQTPPSAPVVQIPKAPQVVYLPSQSLDSAHALASRNLLSLVNQMIPQLQLLSSQNKQASVKLQQTNQFLTNIQQANQFFSAKINELKLGQDQTNHRLNQTCLRMRDVIMKQSQLINSMINDLQKDIEFGRQRVTVLEGYSQKIQEDYNIAKNNADNARASLTKNKPQQYQQQYQHQPQQQQQQINTNHQPIQSNGQSVIQSKSSGTQTHHEEQGASQSIYNKKSMESMREMTQSMAVRKPSKKKIYESTNEIQQGGIYRQKLMQQLRAQQKAHVNDPNYMEESTTPNQFQANKQSIQNKPDDGYHWSIGQRQQLTQAADIGMKKTQSQQSEEDESEKLERAKHQQQIIDQQRARQQQQAQANLQAQQQAYMAQQAQAQAQVQAQVQAQAQAQIQAQIQAAHQNASPELKMKQFRLIQMINYLDPIKPEHYQTILHKVVLATETQIDTLYAHLYKQYLDRVQKQKKQAQEKGSKANIVSMPNQDEFRTNNFKNENQPANTNSASFF